MGKGRLNSILKIKTKKKNPRGKNYKYQYTYEYKVPYFTPLVLELNALSSKTKLEKKPD